MSNENQELRSISCERFALLTFIVKCKRRVDVFWRDYSGRRVKYATLQPGAEWDINTFETHPWEFRDANTTDELMACDDSEPPKSVYYPKAWRGNDVTKVYIDIPVYSLRERCLQVARALYDESVVRTLFIPRGLQDDLLNNPPVQYDVRMHFQPDIH